MSLVELFAPHLPYLRRYARALTGSQESGDAYVRASLTALSEDPGEASHNVVPRVALYTYFHAIWEQTGSRLETGEIHNRDHALEQKLQALPPMARQALLLTAMEGFSHADACQILGLEGDALQELLIQANAQIEAADKTTVLIIEDEPVIAADLESIVEELDHKVVGIATTQNEAIAMAGEYKPGLVLCDIQLADQSSGLEAAHLILNDQDIPLIFITAYPERLLTGQKPEPAYLVTKPFQAATVKAAISQALFTQ